jgi:hypothetical protein
MTKGQESRLSMYNTSTAFSDANASIVENLPNYASHLTTLKSIGSEFQSISEQQKIDNTGITENKNQLKATLIVLAADNARKLTTFAKFTQNLTLLGEVNYSESDFKRFSDTAIRDYAQIIWDRAQANLEQLTNYGIQSRSQQVFQNAISTYSASLSTPRIRANLKKQATKKLADLFKAGDIALANMDAAVEIIRLTQPDFYSGYKTARKIIAKGIGKLSVKGLVIDAQSGEALKGVIISFVPDTGMAKMASADSTAGGNEIVKKSAGKGGFHIKSLAAGTYRVTLKKAGYADQTIIINVNDGERTEIKVKLEKI